MFGSVLRRGAVLASRNLSRSAVHTSSISSSRSIARTIVVQPTWQRNFTSSLIRTQQAQESESQEDDSVNHTILPTDEDGPATTFEQLAERKHVHPNLLQAIMGDMGLTSMYPVQKETMNAALTGRDVIAQARTGTGKTLAFLLPIMQHILKEDPQLARRHRKRVYPDDIRGIIISPTRELAEQIAVEAEKIGRHTGIVVQLAVGGTQKNLMLRKTQYEGCHLLVGTPGRLKDILSDPSTKIAAPKLATFVLDEADRLLDAGFLPEIEEIKRLVPDLLADNRQTMMMSATISHEVVDLVRNTLQPGFKFVQCVDPNEAPTHDRIPQHVVVTPGFENFYPAMYELLIRAMEAHRSGASTRPVKALVFFNSGYETILASRVFSQLLRKLPDFRQTQVLQIHSKLTQAQRTLASERFRNAKSGILMSTDVTARGLDFPDVTHVIQIGLPGHGGRESYIHRLGRTGRAGKEGEGWLFISKLEQNKGEHILGDLPLKPDSSLKTASIDLTSAGEQSADVMELVQPVKDVFSSSAPEDLENTYRSYLGNLAAYRSQDVVDQLNNLSKSLWGMTEPPSLSHSLATKLGYSKCHGLNFSSSQSSSGGSFGRSSFGSSGGFGSGGGYGGSRGGSGGFGGGRGGFDRGGSDRRGGFERGGGFDRGSSDRGGSDRRGGFGGGSSYGGGGSRFGGGDRDQNRGRGGFGGSSDRSGGGSFGQRRSNY